MRHPTYDSKTDSKTDNSYWSRTNTDEQNSVSLSTKSRRTPSTAGLFHGLVLYPTAPTPTIFQLTKRLLFLFYPKLPAIGKRPDSVLELLLITLFMTFS